MGIPERILRHGERVGAMQDLDLIPDKVGHVFPVFPGCGSVTLTQNQRAEAAPAGATPSTQQII